MHVCKNSKGLRTNVGCRFLQSRGTMRTFLLLANNIKMRASPTHPASWAPWHVTTSIYSATVRQSSPSGKELLQTSVRVLPVLHNLAEEGLAARE